MVHELVADKNTENWLKENFVQVGEHLYLHPNQKLEISDNLNKDTVQIVFLMGGSGTRLLHVTKNQFSKHMIGVGEHPLSRYVFDLWANSDFKNFSFLIDDSVRGNSVKEYYGDGSKLDVNISYSIEHEKLGSGGALKLAIDNGTLKTQFINHFPDDEIVNYENFPEDFFKITQAAEKQGYDCVIVCVPGTIYPYGEVLDVGGKVNDFVEKPFINKDSNVGLFWLSEKALPLIKNLDISKGEVKIERTVLKQIAQRGKMLKVLLPSEMWIPVNDDPNLKKFEEIINK